MVWRRNVEDKRFRRTGSRSLTVTLSIIAAALVCFPAQASESSLDGPTSEDSGDIEPNWSRVTSGLPVGTEYLAVDSGDVNNDGRLDIVGIEAFGMHAFIGDGAGNFAEQSAGIGTSSGVQTNIVLADFNNDGSLDIAGDGVYLGNGGRGGSMSWTQTTKPGNWYAATAADVNLDGKMDIVAGTGSGVRVWRGNGGAGGTMVWTPASTGLPGSGMYFGCGVGDLNHDGKPDIVCADYSNGIKAWLGNGGTSWTNAYTGSGLPTADGYMGIDLGDVNHDGNLDIAATSFYSPIGVSVWLGNGGAGGTLRFIENSAGLIGNTPNWIGVSLTDSNDDGNLDIIAAQYSGGLKIWLGDGGAGGSMDWTDASTGLPTGSYISVDPGDFNNDGKCDYAVSYSSGVQVWQNERPDFSITGYTSASLNLPAADTWADVRFADFNNDGKLDIGFTSHQGQNKGVRTYLGSGTGIWTNSSTGLPTNGSYFGLRFADLNHDGKLDIVASKEGSNAGVHVWRGDGTGTWTEAAQVTTSPGVGLELADVNDDGDLDVLTGYYAGLSGPMIFLGDGNFGWGSDVGPATSTMNVDDVAAADVNHDGKIDIAASSMNNIGVQLWTGDGSGTAAGWTRNDSGLPITGVYIGLSFADVNHDGNMDLAGAAYAGGAQGVCVWLGNGGAGGTMTWTPARTGLSTAGQYAGIEFSDTNLDGDQDVVYSDARASGSTGIGYRRGNGGAGGTVSWSDPTVTGLPVSGQQWGIAFGDVDNDGIPDLAVASAAGVHVYKQGTVSNLPPTIGITRPIGGEVWSGGSPQIVEWGASDAEDLPADLKVWVNYSLTGGPPFNGQLIGFQGVPADAGPLTWTVPSVDSQTVVLNATVVDTGGLQAYALSNEFAIDSTPPAIISNSPFAGESNVPTTVSIVVNWSEPVNRSSAEAAFSLMDTATWTGVPGTFSWTGITMFFAPTAPLAWWTQYSANVTRVASDSSDPGNPLAAGFSWNFTTSNTVDTVPPTLMSLSVIPDPQEVFLPLNVSVSVQDSQGVSEVSANVTDPTGGSVNISMSIDTVSGRYFLDTGYGVLGVHSFIVWASDTSANWNSTSGQFTIVDTTRPVVTNVTTDPSPAEVLQTTNISALVTDNYRLSGAWIELTAPNLSTTNLSMSPGARYFLEFVPNQLGTYYYTISVSDSVDLWALAGGQFAVRDRTPPVVSSVYATPNPVLLSTATNLTAAVTDNYMLVSVWVEITAPDLTRVNRSMSGAPSFYLVYTAATLGRYTFVVSAVDSSNNWGSLSSEFTCMELSPPTINHNPVTHWRDGVSLGIAATVTDNVAVQEVRLNYTDVDGTVRNATMVYAGFAEYSLTVAAQSHAGTLSYFIWASDGSGNDARSRTFTVTIFETRPCSPTNLTVTAQGRDVLRLRWNPPTENMDGSLLDDLVGFNVFRMTEPGGQRTRINLVALNETTFNDTGLEDGKVYYYAVTAINSRGDESDAVENSGTTVPRETYDWLWMIIAVVLAILAVITAIALLSKRRKREEEKRKPEARKRIPPPPPPNDR